MKANVDKVEPTSIPSTAPMQKEDPIVIAAQEDRVNAESASSSSDLIHGIALCLSGGGYRAMLFHLGTLWRLNDAGLLPRLACISSVSGGSIISALLGLHWRRLDFDQNCSARRFADYITEPIRSLANRTLDVGVVLEGLVAGTINDRLTEVYQQYLYGDNTLQAFPDTPRFVINATNLQTGVLWRFEKTCMGDYLVGLIPGPAVKLALAVAASSAFPPFLSPARLYPDPAAFEFVTGAMLHYPPFTSQIYLADGGVYDNLGLETAWKRYTTILVSDGGGKVAPQPIPARDWARQALRVLELVDNQVRNLRKRDLITSFKQNMRTGSYWGIRTQIVDYQLSDALPCPAYQTLRLALIPTRLQSMPTILQERLINWGYAVCDAALRRHCTEILTSHYGVNLARPHDFPYPAAKVG